jgi:hypothetical protein
MKNGRVVCAEALHSTVKVFTRGGDLLNTIQPEVSHRRSNIVDTSHIGIDLDPQISASDLQDARFSAYYFLKVQ